MWKISTARQITLEVFYGGTLTLMTVPSKRKHIKHLSGLRWNIPMLYGTAQKGGHKQAELQWPSIQECITESRLKMLYKVVSGIVALPAEQYLVQAVNRLTHQSKHRQFTHIPAGADNFRYSFFPSTILEWNQLEDSITTAETLAQFNTGLARSSTD